MGKKEVEEKAPLWVVLKASVMVDGRVGKMDAWSASMQVEEMAFEMVEMTAEMMGSHWVEEMDS